MRHPLTYFFVIVLIGLFFAAAAALAQTPGPCPPKCTITSPIQSTSFEQIVDSFVKYANMLLIPLSTLMVLIAGFFYMTAGGNPEKIKTAHRTLTWAVIGIALVLLAQTAQLIIKSALGG